MSDSEKIGRGVWEAAKLDEHRKAARFSGSIQVGERKLWGILEVRKTTDQLGFGSLEIPLVADPSSSRFSLVEQNRAQFVDPGNYGKVAKELGLTFGRRYDDLICTSSEGGPDKLGVKQRLLVTNYFEAPYSYSPVNPTDSVEVLAQHIMDSLPGGWQITPEPVISR